MAKTTLEQYAAARPNALGRTLAAAPSSGTTQQTKAQRDAADRQARLGAAARKANPAKLHELSHQTQQAIPTAAQVAEKGGGVGGYLRAWRELNQ
jgi:hypothetical protein